MNLFFPSLFLTAELSVLHSVPVWTFPCWPWGPVHRVQVMGSLMEGRLFDLAVDCVSFPQETLRRSLSRWPATCAKKATLTRSTSWLSIYSSARCRQTHSYCTYTCSLFVCLSHTQTYEELYGPHFILLHLYQKWRLEHEVEVYKIQVNTQIKDAFQ